MKRFLLVDDDKIFTTLASKACLQEDIAIDAVNSLKHLKKADLSQYDGFLIDYDLGDGTADQAMEFLLSKQIKRPTALISATSRVEEQPATEQHSWIFISKWQDTTAFIRSVKELL